LKTCSAALAGVLILAAWAAAVQTVTVGDSSAKDFLEGEFEGVYVDEGGHVVLAPRSSEVLCGVDHAWCAAAGADGTVYIGTVPGGVVYRAAGGEAEVFCETGEAGVFALAVLDDGSVAAATGSGGKVFRISAGGERELMADLEEPYVFALARDSKGLLAATGGGEGRVYRLGAESELVYDSPASHILSLAVGDGRVFAGGDNGSVYEITPGEGARVLFTAPQGVIQALAPAGETVFAGTAAIAEPKAQQQAVRSIIGELKARQAEPPLAPGAQAPPAKREYKVANCVYRIDPGGRVREVFRIQGGLVLALALQGGRVLAGAAGEAGIYSLAPDGADEALIHRTDSEEVHDIVVLPGGGFLAAMGMPGKAVLFGPERASRGDFTARVLSGEHVTRWSALEWEGRAPAGTKVSFEVRTGNSPTPDDTWSEWFAAAAEGHLAPLEVPPSRFIRYRIHLATASSLTARVGRVEIRGLPVNLAPQVKEITAGPAGNNGGSRPSNSKNDENKTAVPELSGKIKISWKASDPNKDDLEFQLHFRDASMPDFIMLEENLSEKEFEWDTTRVPDGKYYLRVTASDAPANPAGTELSGARVEGPFVIDNTAPLPGEPEVSRRGAAALITVEVSDAASPLAEAFYSVDGGRWRPVFPVDGIFDSPRERITVKVEKADARIVMLRVSDRAGNTGAVRVILEMEQ